MFLKRKKVHKGTGKWLLRAIRWTRHKQTEKHSHAAGRNSSPRPTHLTLLLITMRMMIVAWQQQSNAKTKNKKGFAPKKKSSFVLEPVSAWWDIKLCLGNQHFYTASSSFPQPLPPHLQQPLVLCGGEWERLNQPTCSSEADNDHLVCIWQHRHVRTHSQQNQGGPAQHQTFSTLIVITVRWNTDWDLKTIAEILGN